MGKGTKENFKEWILGFEKQARKPVVVSLLIEKGKCEFINCISKNRYGEIVGSNDEPEDDENYQTQEEYMKGFKDNSIG